MARRFQDTKTPQSVEDQGISVEDHENSVDVQAIEDQENSVEVQAIEDQENSVEEQAKWYEPQEPAVQQLHGRGSPEASNCHDATRAGCGARESEFEASNSRSAGGIHSDIEAATGLWVTGKRLERDMEVLDGAAKCRIIESRFRKSRF